MRLQGLFKSCILDCFGRRLKRVRFLTKSLDTMIPQRWIAYATLKDLELTFLYSASIVSHVPERLAFDSRDFLQFPFLPCPR